MIGRVNRFAALTLALTFACGILFTATGANAQGAAESDGMVQARRLMEAMRVVENARELAPAMIESTIERFAKKNQGREAVIREVLEEFVMPELLAKLPELSDQIALAYLRYFSAEELKELAAFYTSPAGAKFARVQGTMFLQTREMTRAWGVRATADIISKVIPKLRERGIAL